MSPPTVESIQSLLDALKGDRPENEPLWFRGHGDSTWPLTPSLFRRSNGLDFESLAIKRFKQHALPFLSSRPQNEAEWLFVMQHHGVPTRLLDWTESPLVGLYFAAIDKPDKDGALWCLSPVKLNKIANVEPQLSYDIPGFEHDPVLEQYLPMKLQSERTTSNKPLAVIPARNTPRIQAQAGVFTISHRDETPIEELGDKSHVWKYFIPHSKKKEILDELEVLNISKLTLFPELPSIGDYVRGLLK